MPSAFGDTHLPHETPSMNNITAMPFDQAWPTPFRLIPESPIKVWMQKKPKMDDQSHAPAVADPYA